MRPSPRFHAVLSALPLAVWTVFHLWEQWAAFGGRDAWAMRMRATSRGPLAIAIELAVIVIPLAIWSGLTLVELARGLVDPKRGRPLPGKAREGDTGLARGIGVVAPIATVVAILFLAIHVGSMWGPKIARGASLLETWSSLTHALGGPWSLALYAIGLTAVAFHLAGAIPAALEALGWIESPEGRRSAFLVSTVFALCAWVLAVQLTGWLATGRGTFWPIHVVDPGAPMEAPPEPGAPP